MATHSSILARKILWTEEHDGLLQGYSPWGHKELGLPSLKGWGAAPGPTPWRTSQVGACVVCRRGAGGASRSRAGIFLAATCHRPVLGGQLPERRCSGRAGPTVICQERQASAFAHQAPAGCSQAEASGLFLEKP